MMNKLQSSNIQQQPMLQLQLLSIKFCLCEIGAKIQTVLICQENKNNNPETFALGDNYNVNHRHMIEYKNAKRNHLEDFERKDEDEMRGSNSILRMSHLLPPGAGNKKQVKD